MRYRHRNPAKATVRDAIEYLASACDGAIRRDGHGFNREHAELGHRLAQRRTWTRRDRRRAKALTRCYTGQLLRAGYFGPSSYAPSDSPAWAPDPTGVHQSRFWNGARWTGRVADYPMFTVRQTSGSALRESGRSARSRRWRMRRPPKPQ